MKRKDITRMWCIAVLWLCCILPAGCGKAGQAGQGYFDIVSETEALADVLGEYEEKLGGKRQAGFLGAQFYQGEPIQIWGIVLGDRADVWMYHGDGSRELLLEGMLPKKAAFGRGYLDAEGNLYCWQDGGMLSCTSWSWAGGRHRWWCGGGPPIDGSRRRLRSLICRTAIIL